MCKIFVATSSPRRIKLLSDFGFRVKIVKACFEVSDSNDPEKRAIEKATSKIECLKMDGIIVGFDTVVAVSGKILEKPESLEDARKMILELSNKWHDVITGMAIKKDNLVRKYSVITRVKFVEIQEELIDIAFLKYNPLDKAGAYGIQDFSGIFVEKIEGDYYNVVGLPVNRFYRVLRYEFNMKDEELFNLKGYLDGEV